MSPLLLRLWMALTAVLLLPAAATAQEYADNVVIVLDTSCSMDSSMAPSAGPSKMVAAQVALKTVLRQLPADTRVGLLTFSKDWAYPLSPRDDAKLIQAIDSTYPKGGTPLGGFIKTGADALLKAREEQFGYGSYRLLVVTDGQASDAQKLERYAPEVVARGITMDVIGVAMSEEHALKELAHSYRSADDPGSLVQAVREVLAEVSIDAQDAASSEVFDDLDSLPDAFAMALLQTLSTTGNHPIGTVPKVKPKPPAPGQPAPPPQPTHTPDPVASCDQAGLGSLSGLGLLLLTLVRRSR